MCLAQGPQRNDTGEARTRGHWVSSQAILYSDIVKEKEKFTNSKLKLMTFLLRHLKKIPDSMQNKYGNSQNACWNG